MSKCFSRFCEWVGSLTLLGYTNLMVAACLAGAFAGWILSKVI